jgi:putative phage-type endonuclease
MYKQQLERLLKIPKLEQKTKEWYDARYNLITASDFAQALGEGKFGTQNQLIEKKVLPQEDKGMIKNPFFEWGNLFEPVASQVYATLYNVEMYEFGLIRHPVHDFFGASPDGISEDGIMLEIKCPFKRKINGEVPMQYYYQIQGQLDVCGLELCDYIECEFSKYKDYRKYLEAYEAGKFTGVLYDDGNGKKEYPIFQKELCEKVIEDDGNYYYWILDKYMIKRITKDQAFIDKNIAELKKVWDKIVYYRQNLDKFAIEVQKKIRLETETCYLITEVEHEKQEMKEKKSSSKTETKSYMLVDLD